jgi:hypothetical protein
VIHEYALETELVASWHEQMRFRFFVEQFGFGTGRVVSRYPNNWRQLVRDRFEPTFGGTVGDARFIAPPRTVRAAFPHGLPSSTARRSRALRTAAPDSLSAEPLSVQPAVGALMSAKAQHALLHAARGRLESNRIYR